MDMDNLIMNFFFDDENIVNILDNLVANLSSPLPLQLRPKQKKTRNENFFEIIVPNYNDVQFYEHFGMYKESAEELVRILGNMMPNPDNMAPLRKKLLYSVWFLTKQESFLATSDRFDLPVSSGHTIFRQIILAISSLMSQYIVWPNTADYERTATLFENEYHGFPGIIGAIDSCHIRCKQPKGNALDYCNQKGFHSIILQGTCDHTGKFIDVFIGSPGRMDDAIVFRNSPICSKMADSNFIPPQYHLLGDSAYPLKINLMTPFIDIGYLTTAQTMYNIKLSSGRAIIERAFGHLKEKFKKLKYLDISDFELGNNMIAAACILHNFILERSDSSISDNEEILSDASMEIHNQEEETYEDMAAFEKRNAIVSLL